MANKFLIKKPATLFFVAFLLSPLSCTTLAVRSENPQDSKFTSPDLPIDKFSASQSNEGLNYQSSPDNNFIPSIAQSQSFRQESSSMQPAINQNMAYLNQDAVKDVKTPAAVDEIAKNVVSNKLAATNQNQQDEWCNNRKFYHERILQEASAGNNLAIENLPTCFKQDRSLMVKIALIDPLLFRFASDLIKDDESFIKRMINVNPKTLSFASNRLRSSKLFMKEAIMVNREALKFCDAALLDNLAFMQQMIDIDANNYKFASNRIKSMIEIAKSAFEDNGMLLAFAPERLKQDFELVKIAINSNRLALKFASSDLQNDPELKSLAKIGDFNDKVWATESKISNHKSRFDLLPKSQPAAKNDFEQKILNFLQNNYIADSSGRNLGQKITNQGRFSASNRLINRNFVTSWKKSLNYERIKRGDYREDWLLKPAKARNFNISWRKDFQRIDGLTQRIEKFFLEHELSNDSINDLQTTFLWKVKNSPPTYSFNLYLLRNSSDLDLGPEFANVTSLTAIAQKHGDKWRLSIVEAIFDKEIKVEASYANGHKRYLLWDLLPSRHGNLTSGDFSLDQILATTKVSKKQFNKTKLKGELMAKKTSKIKSNKESQSKSENENQQILPQDLGTDPKLIFRVEGAIEDHFEIYEEQNNGKYQMIYRSPTLPSLLEDIQEN